MGAGDNYNYNSNVLESWSKMISNAVDSDAQIAGLAVIEAGSFWMEPYTATYIDRMGVTSDVVSDAKGSPGETINGFNPVASYTKWSEKIPALWTQWESTLPDPANFEPLRQVFYEASAQLAIDPKPDGYDINATSQQAAFSQAMYMLTSEVGLDGQAMIAFNRAVASKIPFTGKAQAAACLVGAYAVQAEQAVWKTARTNLDKTISDAVTAFGQAYPGGGGGGDLGWLSMVNEIGDVLSLIPGPQQPFVAGVSTAAGTLCTIDKYLGSDVKPSPLRADSPDEVCTKVTNALHDLNQSIIKGESAIAQGCTSAKNTIHGAPDVYDLSPDSEVKAVLDDDNPRHFLALDVEYGKLQDLAERTLPDCAKGFDFADGKLADASNAGYWDRPAGIGQNPFAEFSGLVGELDAVMQSTAWKIRTSAQHMEWVIRDFKKTDDWVAAAQADLTKDTQSVSYTGPTP